MSADYLPYLPPAPSTASTLTTCFTSSIPPSPSWPLPRYYRHCWDHYYMVSEHQKQGPFSEAEDAAAGRAWPPPCWTAAPHPPPRTI